MPELPRPRNLRSTIADRRLRQAAENNKAQLEGPQSGIFGWPARVFLLLALILTPWAFGAVYASAQFFMAVCLALSLIFWWLDLAVGLRKASLMPLLVLPLIGGLCLGIFQTIPLPRTTAAWIAPQQTKLYDDAYQFASPDFDRTYTVSLDREGSWHQVQLLALALAGLLLGGGLFQRRADAVLLMTVLAVNGVALSFFALIQKFTWNQKLYWVYQSHYEGMPFGPFVNRNNAAGYLLLCLAATIGLLIYVWNQRQSEGPLPIISREIPIWRQWQQHLAAQIAEITASKLAVLIAALFVAVTTIVSLSRGGVVALFVASIFSLLCYGMARRPKTGGLLLVAITLLVIVLCSWIGFFDELANRFDKVKLDQIAVGSHTDDRLQIWRQSLNSCSQTGWLGAGLGAFPSINRIYAQVSETAIAEYAENQFVQSLVDGGVFALSLLVLAVGLLAYSSLLLLFRGSSPQTVAYGGLGIFLVAGQVTAGCFDFGLYIPANMLLGAVLAGMVSFQSHYLASRLRKLTALRLAVPEWAGRLIGLGVFAITVFVAVELFHRANYEAVKTPRLDLATAETLEVNATNNEIEQIGQMSAIRDGERFSHLGLLYLHRARIVCYEGIKQLAPLDSLPIEKRREVVDNLWDLTNLLRLEEQLKLAEVARGPAGKRNFRSQSFMRDLEVAYELFRNSILAKPVQPEIQARMGQIQYLLGAEDAANSHLKLAVELAPTNTRIRLASGLTLLLQERAADAIPHLRRILELNPGEYSRVIGLVLAKNGRLPQPVDKNLIATQLIPDNPEMLFKFATENLDSADPLAQRLLNHADSLLGEVALSDDKRLLLRANIRLAKGDMESGIAALEGAVVSSPYDQESRYRLATLLLQNDRLEQAQEHVEHLVMINAKSQAYAELRSKIRARLDERRSGKKQIE